MDTDALRRTAFRGDPDVEALHAFFQPERQFAGDTLWSFGTSLKSAYVNSFEFMNHAPVVQLWRDADDTLQAVSRLGLGTGEWLHQASPEYRSAPVTNQLIRQADAAFELLSDHASWHTVRYESCTAEIDVLLQSGYTADGVAEVYMTRSLAEPIEPAPLPTDVRIHLLDATDLDQVHARAMAQIDAFSNGEPTAAAAAWITRSLPHQLSYGQPHPQPHVTAVDAAGLVLAFADVFCDRANKIGEFEPVGTRTSRQRSGLSTAVLARGLAEMSSAGMRRAVVRTGCDNPAAIAAYESAGFTVTDRLHKFRRQRTSGPSAHR